jgi:hypothetical protein
VLVVARAARRLIDQDGVELFVLASLLQRFEPGARPHRAGLGFVAVNVVLENRDLLPRREGAAEWRT